MKTIKLFSFVLVLIFIIISCKKNEPEPPQESSIEFSYMELGVKNRALEHINFSVIMQIDSLRSEVVFIIILILLFPAAFLLTIATRLALKFQMLFWTAYMIRIIESIVQYCIVIILMQLLGQQRIWLILLVGIAEYFFVSSVIYGLLIKHPETGGIGLIKGMFVTLYLIFIMLALGLIFIIPTFIFRFLR